MIKEISDQQIEKEIQEKGLTAPRVETDQIDALVESLTFRHHHFKGTTLTVAAAILPNGFTVATAESACASPENFNADLGAKIAVAKAQQKAREKLWELEGYALKKVLSE